MEELVPMARKPNSTAYVLRPPGREDAELVVDIMNTCQIGLGDAPDMTVAELLKDWVGANLNDEAVLVQTTTGEIVGFADLMNRNYVQMNVYAFALPGPHQDAVGARGT